MTSISNLTVTLSADPNGGFDAMFSDGTGFRFDQQDLWQALTSMDRQTLFFFIALQAFVSNGKNPKNMTLAQIKTLLEAQTYPAVTLP